MKFPLPPPVTVKSPTGEDISISAQMLVEHVVKTGRDLGLSSELEKVRAGARILAAFAAPSSPGFSGDLSQADAEALTSALRKPARGWAIVPVQVAIPTPTGTDRVVTRQMAPSALDLLPLLNGLLGE